MHIESKNRNLIIFLLAKMTKTKKEKLIAKRTNAIRALQYHVNAVNELDAKSPKALSYAEITWPLIESSYEKCKKFTELLEDLDDFDDDDLELDEQKVREIYVPMATKLKEILNETINSSHANTSTSSNHNESLHDLKLPALEIPKFSGKFEEWTTFYDTFSTYVDQSSIPKVNKMHYLKKSLTGTAYKMIQNMPASDANYEIAWNLLCDRFHNKRAIVNSCLRMLMDQEPLSKPSSYKIRELIDTTNQAIQCIETVGVEVENWDPILVYIIQKKLDKSLFTAWETELKGTHELPSFNKLSEFLETQYRICDSAAMPSTSSNSNTDSNRSIQSVKPIEKDKTHNKKHEKKCMICDDNHSLFFCPVFDAYTHGDKWKYVNENQLCKNCLHPHKEDQCKSKYKCKVCKGNHNTKLHNGSDEAITTCTTKLFNDQQNTKLSATAIVKVKDKKGATHLLRAFIDGLGSEGNMITESAAQMLGLPRKRENVPLTGLDGYSLGKATSSVRIQVQSAINNRFSMTIDALVKKSIISSRTHRANKDNEWQHLQGIALADPHFMNANQIDLLLGIDVYATIIEDGLRKGEPNEPIAQNSAFGWLVFGVIPPETQSGIRTYTISISDNLRKFWENEEVQLNPIFTEEQKKCVEYCKQTTIRLPNGRIQTSLPFNMDRNDANFLGDSRKMALKRFYHLEKKFEKDPEYHKRYNEDIMNYIKSGHMSISKSPQNEGYYLPHHSVLREDKTTSKLRTVFDGSAKSSNGVSLNERCLNGPTIQPELIDIFIRWRLHKVALVADIEKMYRQIMLAPEDRKYHKILYRFSKSEPIRTYEMNTVTFGIKSAPYMAIQATFFLADLEQNRFPEAAKRIKTDMYVDDCLSGNHSIESAKNLQQELNGLFNSAQIPIRKWASNYPAALDGVPSENKAISSSVEIKMDESIKTLGMTWTPATDTLHFTINMSKLSCKNRITKRQLLSDASKLYDPCGLLSPITIISKIMMQKIWKLKTDWDEFVPENIQKEWNAYRADLPSIENIKIERWLKSTPNSTVSLHGFCDSSERATAALIYLVQSSNDHTSSTLVCSKTRVTPIKPITIPRLELNGAVLLANLMNRVAKNLNVASNNIHLWTDSSIVLCWIKKDPSTLKSFIAYRVGEIQKLYDESHWHHVRTHENPADIASRGVMPSELINNFLWFFGPSWLTLSSKNWPKLIPIMKENVNLEEKTAVRVNIIKELPKEMELLRNSENYSHLLDLTARCLRFIYQRIQKNETLKYPKEYVTREERTRAKFALVRYVQSIYFAKEINDIKKYTVVGEKSPLKTLSPQLNEHGILVVHGRLARANLSKRQRFPMILPAKSNLSALIIREAHQRVLHGTIQLTIACIRQEFWILNLRNAVKTHIHNCRRCFRQNPRPLSQLMAPLPEFKTTPSFAFDHCGLDFAGPIQIKSSEQRNARMTKAYICVFVCMYSKAAHLELVTDLSTAKFMLALRRMMGRRGISSDIYCDQGRNFIGASNELPLLFLQAQSTESTEIAKMLAKDGIKFHFIPPSAPNWGGQWESFVKLTKHHLYRITTHFKLTYEEMNTVLIQIEACLNSRPLSPMGDSADDFDPITPGHLILGRPINLIPEPSLLDLKRTTLDRNQDMQRTIQEFWKRFNIEYLHTLHPRKKWYKPEKDLAVNDMVSIIEENLPPGKWIIGRVLEVHPSPDGYIRLVTVKTPDTILQRPITKLCKFPPARENVQNEQ